MTSRTHWPAPAGEAASAPERYDYGADTVVEEHAVVPKPGAPGELDAWLLGTTFDTVETARSRVTAAAKRQTTTAANKAASDMLSLWTGGIAAPAAKRKRLLTPK